MKLGPVIRLDKKQNSVRKLDDDVIWGNRDVIVFPIYSQFRAIWKPDCGRIICKTYILINLHPLLFSIYVKDMRQAVEFNFHADDSYLLYQRKEPF